MPEKSGCGKMKIYKKCLEKYSVITAKILTDRQTDRKNNSVLFCCSKFQIVLFKSAMRPRLFRGRTALFSVSTHLHFDERCSGEGGHAPWHCKGGRINDGENQSIQHGRNCVGNPSALG